VALSRAGARVVESGPGGENLAAGAWQRLEALPDPRSPQGRIYPLACLIAIAVCAFTAAGNSGGLYVDRYSHNEYLQVLTDLGIAGAALAELPTAEASGHPDRLPRRARRPARGHRGHLAPGDRAALIS
jgi:hypothetical protein